MRPFRFSSGIFNCHTRDALVETARRAESLGYSSVVMPDHYVSGMLSPLVALQCAADATTSLRLGTYVIANDYRHPAELAKQFATLDVLSGGRAEIGIGSGYAQDEYAALGLAYEPAGTRVERLGEAVEIIRRLLDGERLTYAGKHYQIQDYENFPKPVQERLPIMVGGGGRKVLSIAARHADIVGFAASGAGFDGDPFRSGTWDATKQKVQWVREAAPERFEQLTLNSYSSLFPHKITDDAIGEAEKYLDLVRRQMPAVSISARELLESPHCFVGTADAVVEKFHRMRGELGISSFMLYDPDSLAPVVERLAESPQPAAV